MLKYATISVSLFNIFIVAVDSFVHHAASFAHAAENRAANHDPETKHQPYYFIKSCVRLTELPCPAPFVTFCISINVEVSFMIA